MHLLYGIAYLSSMDHYTKSDSSIDSDGDSAAQQPVEIFQRSQSLVQGALKNENVLEGSETLAYEPLNIDLLQKRALSVFPRNEQVSARTTQPQTPAEDASKSCSSLRNINESSIRCSFKRVQQFGKTAVLAQISVRLAKDYERSRLVNTAAELNSRLPRLKTGVCTDPSGHEFFTLHGQSRGQVNAENMSCFLETIAQDLGVFFAYAKAYGIEVVAGA